MMKFKHTPGPWSVAMIADSTRGQWTNKPPTDFPLRGEYVAVCVPVSFERSNVVARMPWRPPFVQNMEQQQADARLMAAAPDLLAACISGDPNEMQAAVEKATGTDEEEGGE